jgi:predicted RNA-binding protein with PUA-like domain
MSKQYWLVKQEPEEFSWADFVRDGKAQWTGVRNFQARNNLRLMHEGDPVLFYHSGKDRCVVGIARVGREAYPDPTASEGDWSAVDLLPDRPLARPVSLQAIKGDKHLQGMPLLKQSRLSVIKIEREHFDRVLRLGHA